LIDNEFIDQVARLAGLSTDEVARREERAPGLLERLARTLAVASPEMFITTGETAVPVESEEEMLVQMTERVIAEAAAEGRSRHAAKCATRLCHRVEAVPPESRDRTTGRGFGEGG
jgi:hypothetical protein